MAWSWVVVKVGGSLFDLPDLGSRLERWLSRTFPENVERTENILPLLVPGGGPTVDVIRSLDHRHGLGEEKSHWLALQALTLNAHFLASILPDARLIQDPDIGCAEQRQGRWLILDAHAFALRDEQRPGHLPHHWSITSDSIAARAAQVVGASRLILLKSLTISPDIDWDHAGCCGYVDSFFSKTVSAGCKVQAINFRILS